MLDGRTKRQSLDALCGPIGRDLAAAHSPNLFRIGFKEDPEKTFAKLVDDPVFKSLWIWGRPELRLGEGCHATHGLDDSQFGQCFKSLKRIAVELATIEDPRRARPLQHDVARDLRPQVLNL